jgi:hypothetical protein
LNATASYTHRFPDVACGFAYVPGQAVVGAPPLAMTFRVGADASPTSNNWSQMNLVLALTHQTGRRLAEIGFLLVLFAGIWLTAAQIPQLKMSTARTIIAGIALTAGGLLLLIATHWGHFG